MSIDFRNEIKQLETMAAFYAKRDQWQAAERLYKELLPLQQRHLGKCSPELAETFSELAKLYQKQGQRQAATIHLKKAIQIWTSLHRLGLLGRQTMLLYMESLAMAQLLEPNNTSSGQNPGNHPGTLPKINAQP